MFTRLIRVGLVLVLGLTALLVAAMSLAGARSTYGAPVADPGGLDLSFGSGGRVTSDFPINGVTNISNEARALAIQPDGKIVVAGNVHVYGPDYNFGLARYNPDGSLDGTFGSSHGF